MSKRSLIGAVLVSLLVAGVGCGSSGPPLSKVNGVLTFKGQPVPDVNVILVPVAGKNALGIIARGVTNAKGEFSLSSNGRPGAAAGPYRVTLASAKKSEAAPTDPKAREQMQKFNDKVLTYTGKGNQQTAHSRMQRQADPGKDEKLKAELEAAYGFPAEYLSDSTSPREFEVKKGEPGTLELKL